MKLNNKKLRILDYLRKLYPEEIWYYERKFGHCEYFTKSGWIAGWRAFLTMTEDVFDTRFMIYPKNKLPKEVYFCELFD